MMQSEFKIDNVEESKVEGICDSVVYTKKSDGHLLELYYLIFWKSYFKEKSTWKPVLAI